MKLLDNLPDRYSFHVVHILPSSFCFRCWASLGSWRLASAWLDQSGRRNSNPPCQPITNKLAIHFASWALPRRWPRRRLSSPLRPSTFIPCAIRLCPTSSLARSLRRRPHRRRRRHRNRRPLQRRPLPPRPNRGFKSFPALLDPFWRASSPSTKSVHPNCNCHSFKISVVTRRRRTRTELAIQVADWLDYSKNQVSTLTWPVVCRRPSRREPVVADDRARLKKVFNPLKSDRKFDRHILLTRASPPRLFWYDLIIFTIRTCVEWTWRSVRSCLYENPFGRMWPLRRRWTTTITSMSWSVWRPTISPTGLWIFSTNIWPSSDWTKSPWLPASWPLPSIRWSILATEWR